MEWTEKDEELLQKSYKDMNQASRKHYNLQQKKEQIDREAKMGTPDYSQVEELFV